MNNKASIALLISCVILGLIIGIVAMRGSDQRLGYGSGDNVFTAPSSASGHKNIWVTSTAYIIDKNADRNYLRVSIFPFSSSTVWVWQATSTELVVVNKGIPISTTTAYYYEIDSDNLYLGEIQLISNTSARVAWFEE